jgi:putative sugar O-methyltransferase
MDILDRIYNFYSKTRFDKPNQNWVATPVSLDSKHDFYLKRENYSVLRDFGKTLLSLGVNCSDYHNADKSRLELYYKEHEAKFLENTNLKLKDIYYPNVCSIVGKKIDKDTIIPVKAYRFGYYLHHIKRLLPKGKKRKIVLDIGGGWGGLGYLVLKNIPNVTYISIDIPTTIPIIAYFFDKVGIDFSLYGEYSDLSLKTIQNKSCIITTPEEIQKIPKLSCDMVVSTACLPELEKPTIDYYLDEVDRICKKHFYYESTHRANGMYLFYKCDQMGNFKNVFKRPTPISGYIPWLFNPAEGNEILEERLYVRVKKGKSKKKGK